MIRMTFIKFLEPYEKKMLEDSKNDRGIVVTVSGLAGSGKTEAAKMIAKKLRLEYFSSGSILRELARKRGVSLEDLCRTREASVDHEIDIESLRRAIQGNVVLDGRLTGWVAGNLANMRIFIFCPPEIRAMRIEKRDNIPFQDALRNTFERDISDRNKYLSVYGVDMIDQSIYDRVVDNSGTKTQLEEKIDAVVRTIEANSRMRL